MFPQYIIIKLQYKKSPQFFPLPTTVYQTRSDTPQNNLEENIDLDYIHTLALLSPKHTNLSRNIMNWEIPPPPPPPFQLTDMQSSVAYRHSQQ